MSQIRTYRSKSRSKYGNKKCKIDGFTFDSMKEGRRYAELKILLREGKISDLELQKEYELVPAYLDRDGKRVRPIYYIADFVYKDKDGNTIIEDVKSEATKQNTTYKLKKKLMGAKGLFIDEV